MTDIEAIAQGLLRAPVFPIPAPAKPGVFAIFISDPYQLRDVEVDQSGLLYIGKSKFELRGRIQKLLRQSGSTLRRSLGAVLRETLDLHPEPDVMSKYQWQYHFADETRLDEWIHSHLRYSFYVIERDFNKIQKALIQQLRPPFNLSKWKNPQLEKVRGLRRLCGRDAHQTLNF